MLTRTQKRKGDEISESNDRKKQKMNEEILRHLTAIKTGLNQTKTDQQAGFQALTTKIDNQSEAINAKFEEVASQLNTRIQTLESNSASQQYQLTRVQNDVDRLAIANELRIAKIPYNSNENLLEIFKKIAEHIQFDITNPTYIPTLRRLPVKNRINGDTTQTGTILAQFVAAHVKNIFYNLYLNKIPVKLSNIGFENNNNFHIGENLTKSNSKLFNSAYNLKKEKKVAQCFTVDGLVNVKTKSGKRPIVIYSEHDLQKLIESMNASNESASAPPNQLGNATTSEPMVIDNTQTVQQANIQTVQQANRIPTNDQPNGTNA